MTNNPYANQLRALAQRTAYTVHSQTCQYKDLLKVQQACCDLVLDLDLGQIDRENAAYLVGGIETIAAMLSHLMDDTCPPGQNGE